MFCVEFGGVFMSGSLIGVLVLLLFCVGGLNLVCGYGY